MATDFSNLIQRIVTFNHTVVNIGSRGKAPLTPAEASWLSSALKEEASELTDAWTSASGTNPEEEAREALIGQVDACGDAVIFAIGGMCRAGLTPLEIDRVLHAIMDANFEKKAGVKPGREGAPDAVKPEGWVGPEARIRGILNV